MKKRAEGRRGSLLAEYFRKAATTKSKFPTLSGREHRVREGLQIKNLTTVAEDSLKMQKFFSKALAVEMGHRCRLGKRTTIGIAFRGNCRRTFGSLDGILRLFRFLKLYGFLGTSATKGTPPSNPRRVQPSGYFQPHRLQLIVKTPGACGSTRRG
jgi:hypothetical protein